MVLATAGLTCAASLAALVADQRLRVTAYAMLAMASTSAAFLGPLLVSALLAGGAAAAVPVTAARYLESFEPPSGEGEELVEVRGCDRPGTGRGGVR